MISLLHTINQPFVFITQCHIRGYTGQSYRSRGQKTWRLLEAGNGFVSSSVTCFLYSSVCLMPPRNIFITYNYKVNLPHMSVLLCEQEHVEGYLELSAKTKIYFATAVALWDAEFYIKVDDDVHVNIGI